jgi:RNA polymerase sigma factor (sigma-70 family)
LSIDALSGKNGYLDFNKSEPMHMNSVDLFESLVSEHYEALFRFACSLTHEESEARDLTQQTFYVWATKGHQLRDSSKARTWLFTTLHRTVLQIRRRQVRFPHHELEENMADLPAVSSQVVDQMDAATVVSALTLMEEIYRSVVTLFYLDDRSYKEIAAVLQLPMGTVKSRIARGLVQLRKNLSLVGGSAEVA